MKIVLVSQNVEEVKDRSERRDVLDQRWANLLAAADFTALPVMNSLNDTQLTSLLDQAKFSAVLLTGGNDITGLTNARNTAPERDRLEVKLIEYAQQKKIPLLGVCRGAQMIAHHFGGKLSEVDAHVKVKHTIELSHPMFGSGKTEVLSFHRFGIASEKDLPKQFVAAAKADDQSVEAFAHESLPIFGILWHPEREGAFGVRDIELIRKIFSGKTA